MSTATLNARSRSLLGFYSTTLGKKYVMAITGFILVGFVLGHMVGNLQVFLGEEVFNRYAALLHSSAELLWTARLVLIVAVLMHIVSAIQLALIEKRARPNRYVKWKSTTSTYASRTMYWSGPIIAVFVVYHLQHLTTGRLHPTQPFPGYHEAYQNVVVGFQVVPVSIFYIFAMGLLCLHLYHGIWSMFQTLGIAHPRYTPLLRNLAIVLSFALLLGFSAVPLAVMAGVVH
ncbi:MAG: succinate dehydrogenase cytochrome b subunit [Bryobacterales bacterium]|nr:succinate dehydrogenase cytochrome b subunit [Bryobacterales bacterium]